MSIRKYIKKIIGVLGVKRIIKEILKTRAKRNKNTNTLRICTYRASGTFSCTPLNNQI